MAGLSCLSNQVLASQGFKQTEDWLRSALGVDQPAMGKRVRLAVEQLVPNDALHGLLGQQDAQ